MTSTARPGAEGIFAGALTSPDSVMLLRRRGQHQGILFTVSRRVLFGARARFNSRRNMSQVGSYLTQGGGWDANRSIEAMQMIPANTEQFQQSWPAMGNRVHMGIAILMHEPQIDFLDSQTKVESHPDHFDVIAPTVQREQRENVDSSTMRKRLEPALCVFEWQIKRSAGDQIKETAGGAAVKRLALKTLALIQPARTDGDVSSAAQCRLQMHDFPDRLAQICIAEHDRFTVGKLDAAPDSEPLTAVRNAKDADPAPGSTKSAGDFGGQIGGTVVNDDDLARAQA
ncbi:hypothetical protein SBA5_440024 [Candidatus Sulfotelmatomonas gaucii]|uniref:Uncharacterized protein n=1 Tax=Candidatus Sulfuritelmatomonas gaucii TaxID=2043161 RepID=A0A2N9LLW2_9BACT|nr:hypothetical protein SBA5_440024 [Candidatus Sulfotelmatomonas gaucii]